MIPPRPSTTAATAAVTAALGLVLVAALAGPARGDAPVLGLTVDAGVPDGANAAFVLRPVRALRLTAGTGWNGITRGYRAGATLVPWHGVVSPTLSVDVGGYPEGDANALVRAVTGDATTDEPTLRRVGYHYANAHAGLELGRGHVTMYVHAGWSLVTGTIHELAESMMDADSTTAITIASSQATIRMVSARLGLIVYFR